MDQIQCLRRGGAVTRARRCVVLAPMGVPTTSVGRFWLEPRGSGFQPFLVFSAASSAVTNSVQVG